MAAGYFGVPRRVIVVDYSGEAPTLWQALMAVVGVGGTIMAAALFAFAVGIAMSLLPRWQAGSETAGLTVGWGGVELNPGATAWVGPTSVLAIVAAMYLFTAVGFELMQALPVIGVGGGH
ncbi:MAG: hypothetical protein HYY38_01620 [Rhodospirillales bacterium]|nr:hypothetical protein [Rhodospirillales bacterium]